MRREKSKARSMHTIVSGSGSTRDSGSSSLLLPLYIAMRKEQTKEKETKESMSSRRSVPYESCLNFHSDLLRLDNIPLRPPTTTQPCIFPSIYHRVDPVLIPVLRGYEVTRRIKRHTYTTDKPIGVLTVIDSTIWCHIEAMRTDSVRWKGCGQIDRNEVRIEIFGKDFYQASWRLTRNWDKS